MQAIFENFGIYVHVPFCAAPCGYCRFYKRVPTGDDIREYVKICTRELELLADSPGLPPTDTVFWGGGTPSILRESEFEKLAGAFGRFPKPREWTIEVSPSTISREKLSLYKQAGVTRISLGVQSFDEGVLKSLGRSHSLKSTLEAIDAVAETEFDNFSIDLIFGAKGQTEEMWRADLRRAAKCSVNHISAYCLEFENGTSFCGGIPEGAEIQKREREGDFFEIAMDELPELGFKQYEISNYARPGGECLHNLSTWNMAQWVGIGPSAASQFGGFRYRNSPNFSKWKSGVESGKFAREDIVVLDDEEMFSSALIFGLRMGGGVDMDILGARFPRADRQKYEKPLEFLLSEGLIERDGARVRLTRRGKMLADSVAVELL